MSKFVDRPRYVCALGGALATLRAIPRTIPIIHAAAGCGYNLYNAINAGGGYLGGGYCGGSAWSSSNVAESDIVFGGEERLREQIETTLELMDGDLYLVLTGCMVEMIGDDIDAVAAPFAQAGKPVIAIHTPSFRGNSYTGYDLVLQALARKYITKEEEKDPHTVNVLGIVPAQDVFWQGNLREIKKLLQSLGLHVNTFFGEGETLADIKAAGKAALNIVVSDIYGREAAITFAEEHNIPALHTGFPFGADGTVEFLRSVSRALHIDDVKTEAVIRAEQDTYYTYLERLADLYNDIDLQRYAIVVADANYAPAVSRFLADELGWLPELVVITDFVDEKQKQALRERFAGYESGLYPRVEFDTDTSSVRKYLAKIWPRNRNERHYDAFSPTVILGSSFEREIAQEFGFPLLPIAFPIVNRIVLNRAYAGFNGALALTEDLLTLLVSTR